MNNFVIDTPDNFWQIRWLDKYMEGHKGFIAGGCFKNILSGEKVKDIDIFFESESNFQEAIDLFNDEKHQKEGWKFKYRCDWYFKDTPTLTMSFSLTEEDFRVTMERDVELSEVARAVKNQHHKKKI